MASNMQSGEVMEWMLRHGIEDEDATYEYDSFLCMLDDYDRICSCIPYIKKTYPQFAKGMEPYLDLMLENSKYQLKKEYEQKYRKAMGYPSGGKLVRSMVQGDIISAGEESYRRESPKIVRTLSIRR